MKRRFDDYTKAEDWLNDLIFGGDDRTIVGELVEVWPDEATFNEAWLDDGWGTLYAVWGTQAELDAEIASMGEWMDRKGQTGWPEEEE